MPKPRGEHERGDQMHLHRAVEAVRGRRRASRRPARPAIRDCRARPTTGTRQPTKIAAAGSAPAAASLRQAIRMVAAIRMREHDHRRIGVPVGHDHERRREQIGAERNRRDRLDLAGLGLGTEQEAGDDQRGRQRKSGDHAERVRRKQAGLAHCHQRPQHAERDGGDREPAPHADAREAERGRGDDGDVDVKRPVVRLVGGDQDRRDERADDAEAGERRAVQQRRGKRCDRDEAERDERRGGREEVVQRVGGIHGAERDRGAGGGEDRRDVGDRDRCDRGDRLLAAGPFAGGEQAAANSPPKNTRAAGPSSPASIE